MTPAIEAHAIRKTYNARKKSQVDALQGVSFSVGKGEIVGLIGPNGAGKSTLLRILLGLIPADEGSTVSIFGAHPEAMETRRRIGYQADAQFVSKHVSTNELLTLHARLAEVGDPATQISEYISFFNLKQALHRKLGALSKGMRQKVELILAFIGTPELVFLDEPTAALDPPSVFELREFLGKKKQEGVTVFFSSHNLSEVENICDRVLFINDGQLLAEYSLSETSPGFLEEAFRKHIIERKGAK
jgi:ABC-2 type transport system ATP-binding protein